jgi:hypothetical protein
VPVDHGSLAKHQLTFHTDKKHQKVYSLYMDEKFRFFCPLGCHVKLRPSGYRYHKKGKRNNLQFNSIEKCEDTIIMLDHFITNHTDEELRPWGFCMEKVVEMFD